MFVRFTHVTVYSGGLFTFIAIAFSIVQIYRKLLFTSDGDVAYLHLGLLRTLLHLSFVNIYASSVEYICLWVVLLGHRVGICSS